MSGIKSAYELAMERAGGEVRKLSEEQKAAIADIESTMQAKLAETEIMFNQQAEAEANPAKASLIQQTKVGQLSKIRANAEAEKDRIRNG